MPDELPDELPDDPYACTQCGGDGEDTCDCCAQDIPCPECSGTGLDNAKLRVRAFLAAETMMMRAGPGSSWQWDDSQEVLGRVIGDEKLAYEDFKR